MVDIRRGEEIVGHVRADARVVIAPLGGGGDPADLADELLVKAQAGVGVALNRVLPAGPVPFRRPRCARAGGGVHGGALRAGAGVFAPQIVVDGVHATGVGSVLIAELGLLGDGGAGDERCQKVKGLHIQRWEMLAVMFDRG